MTARDEYLQHLQDAYDELERQWVIVTATALLLADKQADKGDGYRLVNALLDIRAVASAQEEFNSAMLSGQMERNAGMYVMAYRALWAILDARIWTALSKYPDTPAIDKVQETIGQLKAVRKDMESLAPRE